MHQSPGSLRYRSFRRFLKNEVAVSGRRVADLGAGPCAFARIAKEFGADVTAVDARDVRVPPHIEELGINFVHSDVRLFNLESFDVVIIFGLLYHFPIDDQIKLLQRCQGKAVLVDTMVCCPELIARYPLYKWETVVRKYGGYEGVVYPEKDNPMASVENRTSFWHTDSSYVGLYHDCGFDDVTAYRPLYHVENGMRSFYRLLPY